MIVVNRFRVPEQESVAFEDQVAELVGLLQAKAGAQAIELVRNVDEPDLWALVSHWADVGSYRRGIGGFETKVAWMAVMPRMVDEPSAYVEPAEIGSNLPREMY